MTTNTKQMKTIGRLVAMKRRNVDQAESAHAAAHAATATADRTRIDADRRWLAALDAFDDIDAGPDELAFADNHIRGLRRAVDEAEQRFMMARAREAEARERMTDARMELRRFETWTEDSEQAQRGDALRTGADRRPRVPKSVAG